MSLIITGSGKAQYFITGSADTNPIIAILYMDGVQANKDYGVAIYKAGQCPHCHFIQNIVLDFNPGDSHYYYHCMQCMKWYRFLNPDGSLSDFQVVTTAKNTPVDENVFLYRELDFWDDAGWG